MLVRTTPRPVGALHGVNTIESSSRPHQGARQTSVPVVILSPSSEVRRVWPLYRPRVSFLDPRSRYAERTLRAEHKSGLSNWSVRTDHGWGLPDGDGVAARSE